MALTDLIPWKRNETGMDVRRIEEDGTLLDLKDQMDRLFDEFFERPLELHPFLDEPNMMSELSPRMDVSETANDITISAELPGLEPEDINVSLDHNALTISGEKRAEKESKDQHYYRIERSFGSFHRLIPLPKNVDESKIDATFKRGVLKLKLPKTQSVKEGSKHITINSG